MFDRGRRLTPSQALVVGLDACRGLDYAHRRGFVHTELTPSKLVFGDDRRLRIADFGLARLLGEPIWANPESVANHVAVVRRARAGAGVRSTVDRRVRALPDAARSRHGSAAVQDRFDRGDTGRPRRQADAGVGRSRPVGGGASSAPAGPRSTSGRPRPSSARGWCRQLRSCRAPNRCRCCRPGCSTRRSSSCAIPTTRRVASDAPPGAAPIVVVPATPDIGTDQPDGDPGDLDDDHGDDSGDSNDHHGIAAASGLAAGAAGAAGAIVVGSGGAEAAATAGEPTDRQPDVDAVVEAADLADASTVPDGAGGGDDLMILPVDSELDGGPEATLPEPEPIPAAGGLVASDGLTITPDPTREVCRRPHRSRRLRPRCRPPPPRRRRGLPWKVVLAPCSWRSTGRARCAREPNVPDARVHGARPDRDAGGRGAQSDRPERLGASRRARTERLVRVVGQVIRTVPSSGVELAEGEPFLHGGERGPDVA